MDGYESIAVIAAAEESARSWRVHCMREGSPG